MALKKSRYLLLVLILFIASPAMAKVILTPAGITRLYVYGDSIQGDGMGGYLGDSEISEEEWSLDTMPHKSPKVLAQDDPLDLSLDGFILKGTSSFAASGIKGKGVKNEDGKFTHRIEAFVNNQATQDPDAQYGHEGWGHSVAYTFITYDTSGVNGSKPGDPMKITLDINLAQQLYAHDIFDEYFIDLGYAIGTNLEDYYPVPANPYTNPGFDQFQVYNSWNNSGASFEEIEYSDTIEYNGVIGDRVQILLALSSFSYSMCGYSWTEALLNESNDKHANSMNVNITAEALEKTVLGPMQMIKEKGHPRYNEKFQARAGDGKIIIKNGDEDGKNRLNSCVIKLNGNLLDKAEELNKNTYKLEIPVTLRNKNNNISVLLKGKAGNYINLEIVQ